MAQKSRSSSEEQTQANESESEVMDEQSNTGTIYEIGFHAVPTLSDTEARGVLKRLEKALSKIGAMVIAKEEPKRITFAYRIERSAQGKREKFTEGYFGWIKFETDREHISGLEEMLRADREILRHLLIHTTREAISAAPRAVFASDRLEGEVIAKPVSAVEESGPVSEEQLDKSLEALVGEQGV
jgi:ribosomal protein S6